MRSFLLSLFILCSAVFSSFATAGQTTVTFHSSDSVTITADWYPAAENAPVILLCHQARFSRGEYKDIAPRLNKFGFNCLAIDQRSGDEVNDVRNETASIAKRSGRKTDYLESEKDIIAAVKYLNDKYRKRIIIWGSAYS